MLLKKLIGYSVSGSLALQTAFADIREIRTMPEILPEISRNSVVVFDLDNTIIEPKQSYGGDQWFEYSLAQSQKAGLPRDKAILAAQARWERFQHLVEVKPVEVTIPALIKDVQSRKIPVIGLTARTMKVIPQTFRQLNGVGVQFAISPFLKRTFPLDEPAAMLFVDGILFSNGADKGKALIQLLRRLNLHPEKIVFIDDKLGNVRNVEKALNQSSFKHVEFRYGAADGKVKSWNPRLAVFQEHMIGRILSDAEAVKLMR